jgi:glycosyltransferase involved in cell wall biosynthesis
MELIATPHLKRIGAWLHPYFEKIPQAEEILVDNHSTDRTTAILRGMSDPRVRHIIPQRRDLRIGGCCNDAIYSRNC